MNRKEAILQDIEAILFDMDGTLIDSLYVWAKIDIEFLGKYGHSVPEDYDITLMGMSFKQVAEYTKERFGLEQSTEEIMAEWNSMAEYKYEHEVLTKPYALDFLKMCYDKGIRMAVCTSNSRHLVEKTFHRLEIDKYMSVILTADEITRGKPAPDIYEAAASKLGVSPEKCLVFEDVIPGIEAGHNAGMKVVAVWDNNTAYVDEKKKEMADYYIKDYSELL